MIVKEQTSSRYRVRLFDEDDTKTVELFVEPLSTKRGESLHVGILRLGKEDRDLDASFSYFVNDLMELELIKEAVEIAISNIENGESQR